MRVAIFGGSFDPPHIGHEKLIKQALTAGVVEEVWLMPAFISPGKQAVASAQDRLVLCRLFVKSLGEKVRVADLEIKRGGESYTLETVRLLKAKFDQKHQFYWLVGTDLVGDLHRWEKAEGLFKEIEFLVFPRTALSSSAIRARIKKQLSITGLVPQEIENYIKKHRLYQKIVK